MPYKTSSPFVVPFWQSCNFQFQNFMSDPPCCCLSSIQHLNHIPVVSLEKLTIDFHLAFQQESWSCFQLLRTLVKPLWKLSEGPHIVPLHSLPLPSVTKFHVGGVLPPGVDRSFKKRWILDNVSMKKARTFFTCLWDFVGRNLFAPEKKRKAYFGNNLVPPKVENTHYLTRSF